MAWTLAPALVKLRAQVNAALPKRSKASDGAIGDAAHAARTSDHNPNAAHVVCAWDCTATPKEKVWESLANDIAKDKRVNYVIYNHRIKSQGGGWRPYTGSSAHTEHIHVSVRQSPVAYNNAAPWVLPTFAPAPTTLEPVITLAISKHAAHRLEGYVLSGVLTPHFAGAPVVISYQRPGEAVWRPWVTRKTDAKGAWSVGTRGYRVGTYTYRATFPGDATHGVARYAHATVAVVK
jgi:hypothetical protein